MQQAFGNQFIKPTVDLRFARAAQNAIQRTAFGFETEHGFRGRATQQHIQARFSDLRSQRIQTLQQRINIVRLDAIRHFGTRARGACFRTSSTRCRGFNGRFAIVAAEAHFFAVAFRCPLRFGQLEIAEIGQRGFATTRSCFAIGHDFI